MNGVSESSYKIFLPVASLVKCELKLLKLFEMKVILLVSRPPCFTCDAHYSLPASSTKLS